MMRHTRMSIVVLLALLAAACAGRRAPDPNDMSGFLDDYSLLRPGGADDLPFVYRKPDAHWTTYRKILLEPVTLWRSGRHALDPIPEEDLLRLVSDFQAAVRRRLGDGFELVDEPSPGTLRLRLAITEARSSDTVLDVLTAIGDDGPGAARGTLRPELRQFIDAARSKARSATRRPTRCSPRASTADDGKAPLRSTRGRSSTAHSSSGPIGCAPDWRLAPVSADRQAS